MDNFAKLKQLIDELNQSNSVTDKVAVFSNPDYSEDVFIRLIHIKVPYDD